VDGTLGGGGHTRMMAEKLGDEGFVVAVDRDVIPLQRAEETLAGLPVKIAHANFVEIPKILDSLEIDKVDGILLDLGLSSDQLADRER
ncbi:MAG: 16S rRNA (cytosine(1402)-N(4))-methyltransferase, partial [Blastopirellula sp. JB062]